jgi:hypothetical protein
MPGGTGIVSTAVPNGGSAVTGHPFGREEPPPMTDAHPTRAELECGTAGRGGA